MYGTKITTYLDWHDIDEHPSEDRQILCYSKEVIFEKEYVSYRVMQGGRLTPKKWHHGYWSEGSFVPTVKLWAYIDEPVEIVEEERFSDPCPDCGTQLESANGGGVKCPKRGCGYWFCY